MQEDDLMSSEEVRSSLEFLKTQAAKARALIKGTHRHKGFSYAGCRDCEVEQRLAFVDSELERILTKGHKSESTA